jgi:hypothetical protein
MPAPPMVPPEKLREDYCRSPVPDESYALPTSRLLHGVDSPDLDLLPLLLDGINRAFIGPLGMGGVGTLIFFAEPFALPLMPADFFLDRVLRLLSSAAVAAKNLMAATETMDLRGREFLLDNHVPVMFAEYLVLKVGMIHSLRAVPRTAMNFRRAARECERAVQLLSGSKAAGCKTISGAGLRSTPPASSV